MTVIGPETKAVRIISLKKYNPHTEPIFKELNLLNITDIYTLNEYKFYYKYVNNNLPHYFQTLPLNHIWIYTVIIHEIK